MCRACEFCYEYAEKFPEELANGEVIHFICNIIDIYGGSWSDDDKTAALELIKTYLQGFNEKSTSYTY